MNPLGAVARTGPFRGRLRAIAPTLAATARFKTRSRDRRPFVSFSHRAPRPLKSDGGTGWVNKWNGISFCRAGFFRDLKYGAGYPGEEVGRLVADAEPTIDVAPQPHSTTMAETMFHGVRLGGIDKFQRFTFLGLRPPVAVCQ